MNPAPALIMLRGSLYCKYFAPTGALGKEGERVRRSNRSQALAAPGVIHLTALRGSNSFKTDDSVNVSVKPNSQKPDCIQLSPVSALRSPLYALAK